MAERATVPAPDGPDGWVSWSFDAMHRARSPLPYRHAHHLPLLHRIACPVLALHPGASTFSAIDVDLLESAVPGLDREVVPRTSHVMHLEEPAAIAAHIVAFWSRIEGYSPA
jgi:pimeloyl-ACP methyl ester carboxylesterase